MRRLNAEFDHTGQEGLGMAAATGIGEELRLYRLAVYRRIYPVPWGNRQAISGGSGYSMNRVNGVYERDFFRSDDPGGKQ